jgi:hypothetical protein
MRPPALITPLPSGSAHFTWRGVDHTFDNLWSALAECNIRGIRAEVQRFPALPVEVTWTSPALQAAGS